MQRRVVFDANGASLVSVSFADPKQPSLTLFENDFSIQQEEIG